MAVQEKKKLFKCRKFKPPIIDLLSVIGQLCRCDCWRQGSRRLSSRVNGRINDITAHTPSSELAQSSKTRQLRRCHLGLQLRKTTSQHRAPALLLSPVFRPQLTGLYKWMMTAMIYYELGVWIFQQFHIVVSPFDAADVFWRSRRSIPSPFQL